jgi:hypothetical protein
MSSATANAEIFEHLTRGADAACPSLPEIERMVDASGLDEDDVAGHSTTRKSWTWET